MALPGRYKMIDNYIYLYHLDKYLILPTYPESVSDNLGSTFASTTILARTAPIVSYSYSGPRVVTFNLMLHRDLIDQFNKTNLNFAETAPVVEIGDDYVDQLIRYLQASALPSYGNAKDKMVNPPQVAVRFGNQIFIKGVVNSDIGITYSGPITKDGKYQVVELMFNIQETDPQDAETLVKWGSFRGLEKALTANLTGGSKL